MRFGVMAMQLGLLLPAEGASPESVRELAARFDIAQLVARLADAGLRTLELNTELELFLPGCYDEAAVRRLAELKRVRGLTYTVHLPLWSIEPATPEPRVREASVTALAEAVQRMEVLAPEVYVLHTTGALAAEFHRLQLPEAARALVLERFQSQARRSLAALLARTGVAPRRFALENVEYPLELTMALAREFDCSLCLDCGHLLAGYSGRHDFQTAVEQMLPRLAEVHLHDGHRRNGLPADHLRLGLGDLPLEWLLDRLTEARFTGPLVLEQTMEDALSSVARVQTLRPGLLAG